MSSTINPFLVNILKPFLWALSSIFDRYYPCTSQTQLSLLSACTQMTELDQGKDNDANWCLSTFATIILNSDPLRVQEKHHWRECMHV
jgi:hypothetical protein